MTTLKDISFRVDASNLSRRRVRLTATDKPPLELAPPPEFRGGVPGMWTPEDFLVAAVASCYVLTFDSVAFRRGLAFDGLTVTGAGHVAHRAEGRLGFVVIELLVEMTVAEDDEEKATRLARTAKQSCIVGHALEIPIELELVIHTNERPALSAVS